MHKQLLCHRHEMQRPKNNTVQSAIVSLKFKTKACVYAGLLQQQKINSILSK